uniref:Uncharacterized protein n=1 Tax=Anguilla anguilla TaxID=7936 RepID=A0A0E9SUC1_ANGAN
MWVQHRQNIFFFRIFYSVNIPLHLCQSTSPKSQIQPG